MSLKMCADCCTWISRSAIRCPNCGAYHWTGGKIIFAILTVAFLAFFVRGIFL